MSEKSNQFNSDENIDTYIGKLAKKLGCEDIYTAFYLGDPGIVLGFVFYNNCYIWLV